MGWYEESYLQGIIPILVGVIGAFLLSQIAVRVNPS